MRAEFRELLQHAETYIRENVTDREEQEWLLRNIAAFHSGPDFPNEREALHAFEKFLHFACKYVAADAGLRATLEPYVAVARTAREGLGGDALPGVGWGSPANEPKR